MSSNFQIFRATGDQLAAQGHLFRQWGRGESGDRCILRVLLDNAGFKGYDERGDAVWRDPVVMNLLRQADNYLQGASTTYAERRESLCREGKSERKWFIVKWHDKDASLKEVVAAMRSLADFLELQELRGQMSQLETTNAALRAANMRYRRQHADPHHLMSMPASAQRRPPSGACKRQRGKMLSIEQRAR